MSQCASRTDCIVFHGKTAGSQVYGHNELLYFTTLLYFSWAKFGSYTRTREMVTPFPMHPGNERRVARPPHGRI